MRMYVRLKYLICWFLLASGLLVTQATAQKPRWIPLNESPSEGNLLCIEAGLDSGMVYTTDGARIWISRDNGKNWKVIFDSWSTTIAVGFNAICLKQDPVKKGTLYVGTDREGVFWTDDYGEHWLNNQLIPVQGVINPNIPVLEIGVSPQSKLVLAGNARTEDNFNHWVPMADIVPGNLGGYAFLKDGSILATMMDFGPFMSVMRSTNQAKSWSQINQFTVVSPQACAPIIVDKHDAVYIGGALTNNMPVLFKSTDGGNGWNTVPITGYNGSATFVRGLTYQTSTNTIYALISDLSVSTSADISIGIGYTTGPGYIYMSKNGGLNWQLVSSTAPNSNGYNSMAVVMDGNLFCAGNPFAAQRLNPDKTWVECKKGLSSPQLIHDIDIDSLGNLYALSYQGGCYQTRDTGKTVWAKKNNGIPSGNRNLLDLAMGKNGTPMYLAGNGGIFRSTDHASNWTNILGNIGTVTHISMDYKGYLYALYSPPKFFQPQTLDHFVQGNVIIGSKNEGKTWDTLMSWAAPDTNAHLEIQSFFVDTSGVIYLTLDTFNQFTNSSVYLLKSTDYGKNWIDISMPISPPTYFTAYSIRHIYANHSGRLYISGRTSEVYYSDDQGKTWTFASQLDPHYFNDFELAIDKRDSLYLTKTRDSSVFFSTDAGKTWQLRSNGFKATDDLNYMQKIVFDKANTPYGIDIRGVVYRYALHDLQIPGDTAKPADTTHTHPKPVDSTLVYSVYIYPNPFAKAVFIDYTLPLAGDVQVTVFDVLGRRIDKTVLPGAKPGVYRQTLNFEHLKPAMYFFEVQQRTHKQVFKIIKYE